MRPSPLAMLHVPSPLSHTQFQVVSIPPPPMVAVEPSTRRLVLGGSFIDLNFTFRSNAPTGDEAKRTKAVMSLILMMWSYLPVITTTATSSASTAILRYFNNVIGTSARWMTFMATEPRSRP